MLWCVMRSLRVQCATMLWQTLGSSREVDVGFESKRSKKLARNRPTVPPHGVVQEELLLESNRSRDSLRNLRIYAPAQETWLCSRCFAKDAASVTRMLSEMPCYLKDRSSKHCLVCLFVASAQRCRAQGSRLLRCI